MKRAITVGALAVATVALVPVPQAHAVNHYGGCVVADVRPVGPIVDSTWEFEFDMAARRDAPMPPWGLPFPQSLLFGTMTTVTCDIKRPNGSVAVTASAEAEGYVVAESRNLRLTNAPRGEIWSVCGTMTGSDGSYEDLGCQPFMS